ncbi:MAG: SusD/RagB family nutrient-binding outer membrane lipoprotein, partial [Bacteroidales bacterium]|nr:SusD/RagB family nutrient-binding outer membrane lipoprotein [Bacteroidales bacterium]
LPQDPGMADIEYMNGIGTSLEWWKRMIATSKLPSSGIKYNDYNFISSTDSAYYGGLREFNILNVFGSWMAATDKEKLEFIYTQRWLDFMMQPQEAYALARRTGATPREGSDHINHFRMPYPPSEQEFNNENWQAAKNRQGGDETFDKIWWIPENY